MSLPIRNEEMELGTDRPLQRTLTISQTKHTRSQPQKKVKQTIFLPEVCQRHSKNGPLRKSSVDMIIGLNSLSPTFFLKLVMHIVIQTISPQAFHRPMQHYHNHRTSMLQFTYLPTESSRKKERNVAILASGLQPHPLLLSSSFSDSASWCDTRDLMEDFTSNSQNNAKLY